jgi:hypothetical protein
MFSNSFAGIAPSSAPSFIGAQVVGGILAVVLIKVLYPTITSQQAGDILFPRHPESTSRTAADAGRT